MEDLEDTYLALLKVKQDKDLSKVCDHYYLLVLIEWKTYAHSLKSKIEFVVCTNE